MELLQVELLQVELLQRHLSHLFPHRLPRIPNHRRTTHESASTCTDQSAGLCFICATAKHEHCVTDDD